METKDTTDQTNRIGGVRVNGHEYWIRTVESTYPTRSKPVAVCREVQFMCNKIKLQSVLNTEEGRESLINYINIHANETLPVSDIQYLVELVRSCGEVRL